MQFKQSLDISSRKFQCPRCLKKKFVRYVDNETKMYLAPEFGRCDRESSCGYHLPPNKSIVKPFDVIYTPPKPVSYHAYELVAKSGRHFKENYFIQFLKTIFSVTEVRRVITKYLIGTSKYWDGATVFWQIDQKQKVRHGKIMLYHAKTGKRKKHSQTGQAYIHSVRSVLKLKDFNLKQCLFGLHLINETNTKTLALVESEKTAVIMSLFKPEYVWLATGSKQGFKYDFLKPVKPFSIIAFPDKGEYYDWEEKAIRLRELGFNIKVSDWLETTPFEKGVDLADVYMMELESSKQNHKVKTTTGVLVENLVAKNAALKTLINVFNLTDTNGNLLLI